MLILINSKQNLELNYLSNKNNNSNLNQQYKKLKIKYINKVLI